MPNIIMQNDVGIVIVNWRSKGVILECLEAIKKAGYIQSVVVVDNDSKDGSLEELKALSVKRKVKIIENEKNLGFAEGNNRGIRYLLGNGSRQARTIKFIFILNPDTEINKETIPRLLDVMDGDRKIGIAGPKIYSNHAEHLGGVHTHTIRGVLTFRVSRPLIWSCGGVIDKNRYSGGLIGLGETDKGQYDYPASPSRSPFEHLKGAISVDYIPGTAMMVRREVFEKCGLFNPGYFIYYEDVELNLAAKRAGFKTVFVPSAEILHKESSSMGKSSPAQEYYLARNHLLFVERNAPLGIKLRELVRLPKTIYEHWRKKEKWAIRGIRDYFMRHFGKLCSPSGES